MSEERSISQQVVDYALGVKFSDFPASTVEKQSHSVNDLLACMLAATSLDDTAAKVAEYASRETGPCTILYKSDPGLSCGRACRQRQTWR